MARRLCTEGCGRAAVENEMCVPCNEYGMWENAHSDEGHDEPTIRTPELIEGCPVCHPELDPRNITSRTRKPAATKATYVRRPQLNHKGHNHPQTPKARRTCKEAFWAAVQDLPAMNESLPSEKQVAVSDLAAQWGMPWVAVPGTNVEAATDGSSKTRPAKIVVVPRGPRGGVVKQLKEGKPRA